MIKTFCDCCKNRIPVVNSTNVWTFPFQQKTIVAYGEKESPKITREEKKIVARTYHLCDRCVENIANIFAISGLREEN